MVLYGDLLPSLTGDGLDLGLTDALDADAPLLAVGAEVDPRRLDAEHLADERAQRGGWPPCLTREDLRERVALRLIAAVIDVERDLPLHLRHVTGRVSEQGRVEAVE